MKSRPDILEKQLLKNSSVIEKFGLQTTTGIIIMDQGTKNEPLRSFRSKHTGRELLLKTMSHNEYLSTVRHLRFDDPRKQRRGMDKFCAIGNL